VLLGISIVQGFIYFSVSGEKDSNLKKVFVTTMIVLDFAASALSIQSLYAYTITDTGILPLLFVSQEFCAEYLASAIVIFGTQVFYAYQLYIAKGRSRVVPSVMIVLATSCLITTAANLAELYVNHRLEISLAESSQKILGIISSSTAAVCDILGTSAMVLFLSSHEVLHPGTLSVIKALIFFTVNRGVLVAVTQVGHLIAYLTSPTGVYWLPFHLCQSKIQVITLLAMLNSRDTLRTKMNVPVYTERTRKGFKLKRAYPSPSRSEMTAIVFEGGHPEIDAAPVHVTSTAISQPGLDHAVCNGDPSDQA